MKGSIELSNAMLENVVGGSRIDESAGSSAAEIKAIGANIAARIIAANEALNAGLEISITIQESVLRGTKVFISRKGAQVEVRFVTASQESCDVLQQQAGLLREQLKQTLQQECELII